MAETPPGQFATVGGAARGGSGEVGSPPTCPVVDGDGSPGAVGGAGSAGIFAADWFSGKVAASDALTLAPHTAQKIAFGSSDSPHFAQLVTKTSGTDYFREMIRCWGRSSKAFLHTPV